VVLGTSMFPNDVDKYAADATAQPYGFSQVPRLYDTYLTTALNTSTTSLSIPSTAGLTVKGILVCEQEVMTWDSIISGTDLNVTRGEYGTTAATHAQYKPVAIVITSAHYNDHSIAIDNVEHKLGFDSFGQTPTVGNILTSFGIDNSAWWMLDLDHINSGIIFEKIAEQTFSSAGAAWAWASIPQQFKHLLVLMSLRGDYSGASSIGATFQFNSDTSAQYERQYMLGNASATAAGENYALTVVAASNLPTPTWGGSNTNCFAQYFMWIPQYSNANMIKTVLSFNGLAFTGAGTSIHHVMNMPWLSSAPITRIDCAASAGNFAAGSHAFLYGIP